MYVVKHKCMLPYACSTPGSTPSSPPVNTALPHVEPYINSWRPRVTREHNKHIALI